MEQTFPYQFNSIIDKIARYFTLAAIFFIGLSPTFSNLFVISAVLIFFGGKVPEKLQIIFTNKVNWLALLFLLLLTIGLFYNPYGLKNAFHFYYKYVSRILPLIFIMPLFVEKKWRDIAIKTLIVGAIISIIMFMIQSYHLTDWLRWMYTQNINQFFPPIPFSIYLSIVGFFLLNEIIDHKKFRVPYIISLLVLIYFLYFINAERTGMVIFIGLVGTVCWQRLGLKGIFTGLLAIILLITVFYFTSSIFRYRIDNAINSIIKRNYHHSSIGLRLTFIKYSLEHIRQYPYFGQGTGLYSVGLVSLPVDSSMNYGQLNPENAYLHIALQIGLVGLAVYLWWIALQWYESFKLPLQEKRLLQGLIIGFAIANCCVTALLINMSSIVYLMMLAILYGARFDVLEQTSELTHPRPGQVTALPPSFDQLK